MVKGALVNGKPAVFCPAFSCGSVVSMVKHWSPKPRFSVRIGADLPESAGRARPRRPELFVVLGAIFYYTKIRIHNN